MLFVVVLVAEFLWPPTRILHALISTHCFYAPTIPAALTRLLLATPLLGSTLIWLDLIWLSPSPKRTPLLCFDISVSHHHYNYLCSSIQSVSGQPTKFTLTSHFFFPLLQRKCHRNVRSVQVAVWWQLTTSRHSLNICSLSLLPANSTQFECLYLALCHFPFRVFNQCDKLLFWQQQQHRQKNSATFSPFLEWVLLPLTSSTSITSSIAHHTKNTDPFLCFSYL